MKCQKCGNDCAEGALFCTECGARFDSAANPAGEVSAAENPTQKPEGSDRAPVPSRKVKKKERRASPYVFGTVTRKTLIIAATAVVALLLVAVLGILLVNRINSRSGYTVDVKTRFSTPTPSTLADDHGRLYDLAEYNITSYNIYTSLDGETAAILGRGDGPEAGGVLLLLRKTALAKIADGVTDCTVSDNGAFVAYTVSGGETASLYLYDAKKQSSDLVSVGIPIKNTSVQTALNEGHGAFVLSPDGRSIAFTKQVNNGGKRLYVSVKGSEPVAVATDASPIALSNGGKYIYFLRQSISATEYNYKFSVSHGDDIRNLSLDAAHLGRDIIFNADRTEVMFYDNGSTYISRKAGERQKITGYAIDGLIVPGDGAVQRESLGFSGIRVSVYARKTVAGSAFTSDGGLYFLNRGLEISCITSRFGGCAISPNGKSVYYIDASGSQSPNSGSGKVYYLENIEKNGSKKPVSGELAATGILAPDKFDGVYILDADGTVWYAPQNGRSQKRIADEVKHMNVDVKGGGLYFTTELEDESAVWYSKRGSKKKEVARAERAVIADQASPSFIYRSVFFSIYTTGEDGNKKVAFCRVTSGKRYEKLLEYQAPAE